MSKQLPFAVHWSDEDDVVAVVVVAVAVITMMDNNA